MLWRREACCESSENRIIRGLTWRQTGMADEDHKMPFTAHLEELRKRLILSVAAIAIGTFISFGVKEWLFHLLMRPLVHALPHGQKMIFTGLPEAFFVYLEISVIAGVILAMPVVLYQAWMFVAPGLYPTERQFAAPMVTLSTIFFAGGVLFGYSVVFPFAFKYLVGFETELVRPLPDMKEYMNLASALLLAFGLVFELPLVLTMLARVGIVSDSFLKKKRKYAFLLAFVAAAILTPTPDVFNQFLMAGPIIILYEISIVGAKIFGKKRIKEGEEGKEPSGGGQ
jgi:sec-independent protein translocase protein TatC